MRERKTEDGFEGAPERPLDPRGPGSYSLAALLEGVQPAAEPRVVAGAVHAAGHAVAAQVCGLARTPLVLAVASACTFRPAAASAGRGPARTGTEAAIIAILAGPEAERLFSSDAIPHACGDVARWLTDGDPREAEPYIEWLRLKAARLVEHPLRQRLLAALATALLARGRLSAGECDAIEREVVSRYMRGQ